MQEEVKTEQKESLLPVEIAPIEQNVPTEEKSVLDEAKQLNTEMRKVLDDIKKEREKLEKVFAEGLLSGRGQVSPKQKEMSDIEYSNKVMSGEINPFEI